MQFILSLLVEFIGVTHDVLLTTLHFKQIAPSLFHDLNQNCNYLCTSGFDVIHPPEAVGPDATFIEWHHFHLHHKDQVYISMETVNGALESIHTQTDGYLVDLTAPKLGYLGDGETQGQDKEFQVKQSENVL